MSSQYGRASGRLDLLGGVADYAGSLVLELPTRQCTEVILEAADELVVGPAIYSPAALDRLARLPDDEIRKELSEHPRWTHYVLGVAIVFLRHELIQAPTGKIIISSDLPESVGVASSAALEVSTARAIGAKDIDPITLARLCQEAENRIVGAPCGIMDQVTVAVGRTGYVLPIDCRPAAVRELVPVPPNLEIAGWPTGAAHDVGGIPYGRARAAAFMGKRIVEGSSQHSWVWGSDLPRQLVEELPETLTGAQFIDRWEDHEDPMTTIDTSEEYPIQAATRFGREEHERCARALFALMQGDVAALGECMAKSHAAYDRMGLGHPAATDVVEAALATSGVHGARSSGGGCGGTVVVLADRGALDEIPDLIR